MKRIQDYLNGLSRYLGDSWNQFWFTPSSSFDLCVLRLAVGILLLVWQLSFTPDLIPWLGPDGWFDVGLYHRLVTVQAADGVSGDHLTYLFLQSPLMLQLCHYLGTAILILYTLGVWTRVTSILALVVMLAYLHRAPFLTGVTEMVLSMLVAYLVLASVGDYLSWDANRKQEKSPSSWNTIARRLIQIHLVLIYVAMVTNQLASVPWWRGDAMWWIAAQQDSRLANLDWVRQNPNLMNLWTHGIVLSEIAFIGLVWNRWLRPLVLLSSALAWVSLACATGNVGLTATMLVAHLAFVPTSFWRPEERAAA